MTRRSFPAIGLATAFVVASILACAGPERATLPEVGGTPALFVGQPAALIVCPSSETHSASGVVTPELGGTVAVGAFSITLPAGAVSEERTITVTVPASRFLEVDIRVEGFEHFQFEQPAVVTLDYSRCGVVAGGSQPLTAWYIDGATKTLLEQMGGVDDKVSRTVTFVTPHLSGYAVANRTGVAEDSTSTGGTGSTDGSESSESTDGSSGTAAYSVQE